MEKPPSFEAPKPPRKSDIMSFDEYAGKSHETPYVYELKKGAKEISYFGSRHSFDPKDPMFDQIENQFEKAKPDLVLVEGISDLKTRKQDAVEFIRGKSRDEMITKMGEPGLGLKLAADSNIDYDSPEPKYKDEIDHLMGMGFGKDEIFAYYIYRSVDQFHRETEKVELEAYLEKFIAPFKEASKWKNFDYSISNLKKIGKRIWGDNKNFSDPALSDERTDPTPWKNKKKKQTVVNSIGAEVTNFRDAFIVDKIQDYLKKKNRIFIIYGASHAVMQEPALKKIINSQK